MFPETQTFAFVELVQILSQSIEERGGWKRKTAARGENGTQMSIGFTRYQTFQRNLNHEYPHPKPLFSV